MKVLAIGVAEEQINAIEYAVEQGLYVIGVDRSKNLPGAKIVQEFHEIDLKNVDEIYNAVKDLGISFIIPSTIGFLLTTIGKLNEKLGLPGINDSYSQLLTDKEEYYNYLKKRKLYVPQRIIISTRILGEYIEKTKDLNLPYILKPSKGSGSRGVIVVQNKEEIESAFLYAIENLLEEEVLLAEEYVEGPEYGVDFRIEEGKITILSIREKMLTLKPYRQEVGYMSVSFSSLIYDRLLNALYQFYSKKIKISNVLGHLDVIIDEEILYLVEMSLRPAGLGIMYNYLPHVIGFNPVHNMINVLANKELYNIPLHTTNITFLFLLNLPAGEVLVAPNEDEILNMPFVKNCKLNLHVGSKIETVKSGKDIMPRGYIIMSGDDAHRVIEQKNIIFNKFLIRMDEKYE